MKRTEALHISIYGPIEISEVNLGYLVLPLQL